MRKFLAILLAAVMMVLPMTGLAAAPSEVMAMAEGQAKTMTFTLTPGTLPLDESLAKPVSDLLGAIGLTVTTSGTQKSAVLSLSGKDVLDFTMETADGVSYVRSTLLGTDTVAMADDKTADVMGMLVDYMVSKGYATEEQAAQMKEQLSSAVTAAAATTVDMNVASDLDVQPIVDQVTAMVAKAETTPVTQQPKNCDQAAKVVTLTLTAEDVVALYDTTIACLKKSETMMAQMNSMGPIKTDDGKEMTAVEAMDQGSAKLKEHLAFYKDIPVEVYLDEADAPVFATVYVTKKDGDTKPRVIDFQYARTTTSDGVGHAIDLAVTKDDETMAVTASVLTGSESMDLVTLNMVEKEAGEADKQLLAVTFQNDKSETDTSAKYDASLKMVMTDDETAITMLIKAAIAASFDGTNATKDVAVKLYMGDEDKELLTVNAAVVTGDAPASIVDDKAVRVDEMNAEAFTTFVDNALQNAGIVLIGAVQQLPESVLTFVTNIASMFGQQQ